MSEPLTVTITGVAETLKSLEAFPEAVAENLGAAWQEVGNEVLDTEGLRAYPPAYHAPQFPQGFKSDKQRRYFFWALGKGLIQVPYQRGTSPGSERYGTQFYVEQRGSYGVAIGNRASYAEYLAGGGSKYMAAGAWKKLVDAATEKIAKIEAILKGWIDRAAKQVGL